MSVFRTSQPSKSASGNSEERSNVKPSAVDRACKRGLVQRLNAIQYGTINLMDSESNQRFGSGDGVNSAFDIVVHDFRFYRALAKSGTLGAGDAFVNGWWSCDDLVGLFRFLNRNASVMSGLDTRFARWVQSMSGWLQLLRRNTIKGSKKNIQAHYDLGNSFYSLFLDETMAYSSGIFHDENVTLKQASIEKFERIGRKLDLSPKDHLLEIGTGWGGFAIYAATQFGCKVTTTTISQAQFDYSRKAVAEAGLSDRITVLFEDYRHLTGTYDKLVAIEMIEAVGHEFLDTFIGQCSSLLRDEGLMVLQAITIPDHRYETYRKSQDFIQKYIFPGGCLPSFSSIGTSIRRSSNFRVHHWEDLRLHYAQTLSHWRSRFWDQIAAVRNLGFDNQFIRMWHYYLCYCEAGFRDNEIGLAQIVLSKPQNQRDPIYTIDRRKLNHANESGNSIATSNGVQK